MLRRARRAIAPDSLPLLPSMLPTLAVARLPSVLRPVLPSVLVPRYFVDFSSPELHLI